MSRKLSNSTICESNFDCSYHGQCTDGSCICDTFYSGSTCDNRWNDNESWNVAFIIYGIYAAVLQFTCAVYAGHDLYVTIRYHKEQGWTKWTLTTYIHIIGLIAGTGMHKVIVFNGFSKFVLFPMQ